ncbi:MAG: pyridoxamine 5'-phosphate oxidase family protein [Gammaproteobacteria bacterium]|nr:pyridoxamine 5'-phosphate oxidase family protein [Gammaproteobacteria bacterium]
MKDTQRDIEQLQHLLDASYSNAGSHLKSIQLEPLRLSAQEVVEHLDGACICDLATVGIDAAPYVAPVDILFIKGKAWFCSGSASARFANIRRNARVSLARTVGGELSILIHGVAREVDTSSGEHEFLHDLCIEVYGDSYDSWGIWGGPWAWIEPARMFASKLPQG